MVLKIKILDTFLERLADRKSPFVGELYGILHDNLLIILSYTLKNISEPEELKFQVNQNNFPTEIDLYGVIDCKSNVQEYEDNNLTENISKILQDVFVTDNPLLLSYGYSNKENNLQPYFYLNGRLSKAKYRIISEMEIWKQFVLVNLNIPLNFICQNRSKDVEDHMIDFLKKVSSGTEMFQINESDIYLTSNNAQVMNNEDIQTNFTNNSSEKRLSSYLENLIESESKLPIIINASLLMKFTKTKNENCNRALAIQQVTRNFEGIQGCILLNTLVMFQKNKTEKHLYNTLIHSISRVRELIKQNSTLYNNTAPEICHFYVTRLGHFVTLVYPLLPEDNYSDIRSIIHSKFDLSHERPMFRKAFIYKFTSSTSEIHQLKNVHIGLPDSGIKGDLSIIQGDYLYYHYMHDNINDNGWGCAYRSLQTLFSWYKLQGWTSDEVPSLNAIQQVLVDIGDKQENFVGSRQWIGSLEVSFVLDSLLSVTCRILNIPVGESIVNYAHELANHFRKHGTPVMIGGGVLAHTILGVEINDETDETKFLVLDPHFTGPDKLSIIQSKGWVGWKNSNFWKKDTFYNMCLPYRKIGV